MKKSNKDLSTHSMGMRIKEINDQLRELEKQMRVSQPMHDFLIKQKKRDELEKELEVLIKVNK